MTKTLLVLALVGCAPITQAQTMPSATIPDLVRSELVREVSPVDGAIVSVSPYGAAGWRIQVENNTDAPMSVLLDESSFVGSTGEAGGRLINGNVRKIDAAKAQPAAPVPPHAKFREAVFAEKLIDAEAAESMSLELERKYGPTEELLGMTIKARDEVSSLIVGGKMYVTLATVGGKQTWTGAVTGP